MAAHGPFGADALAPLKQGYHKAVAAMRAARGMASALAAVPGACTPDEFASYHVARQFAPNSSEEAGAWAWARGWAAARLGAAGAANGTGGGGLCFNAGVFIARLPAWRALGLPAALRALTRTRAPPGSERLGRPLWRSGTQRPMRLAFGGEYTPLAPAFNVEGSSNIPWKRDLRTPRDLAESVRLARIECAAGRSRHHTACCCPTPGDCSALGAPLSSRRMARVRTRAAAWRVCQ